MIKIHDKTGCTGCAACAGICPVKCIQMAADEEGFYYPKINQDLCINCHLCEKGCPVVNVKKEEPFPQRGFIVQNKDEKILRESTAGGFYTALAQYVIQNKGKVFGVEIDEKKVVRHVCAETEADLSKFRNSKYVQSYLDGEVIRSIRKALESGELVLFSGTPCQVEGLKKAVGDNDQNLITVDVVCRAVPSPLIFRKYMEYQEKKQGCAVRKIVFRDKKYGYKYSTVNIITDENNGNYHHGIESDPWLRAFFSGMILRPSCYHCRFRKRYRVSDFTIWDCFQVGRFTKELDNDKGVTRVLVHTKKGNELFEKINQKFLFVEAAPEKLVETTYEMFHSVPEPDQSQRRQLFSMANKLSGEAFFQNYYPYNMKSKMRHMIRMLCLKTGIYSFLKKAYVRITKKY